MRHAGSLAAGVLALAIAAPDAMAADCEIKVGVVMELTGPAGEYGLAGAKSVEMAFRDINEAGGAHGCKLVTDTRDSQSTGSVAVDAATQLVQIGKVPALIGGMASQTLNRITFDGKGGATAAERWSVGRRIRDVEVAPDGALWLAEDANPGGLFRVTPKEGSK